MLNVIRVVLIALAVLASALPATSARAATAGACPDPATLPPSPFVDVAGATHRSAVTCGAWYDLVNGVTPDAFAPARAVRRDQMASFLARTLVAAEVPLPTRPSQPFADVAASTHGAAIAQMAELGLVRGVDGTTFAPDAPVRRGQMAAFLVRLVNRVGIAAVDAPDAFADDNGSPHEAAIDQAAALGLARGDGEAFAPTKAMRRDQMASFLARLVELLAVRGVMKPRPVPAYAASTVPIPDQMRDRMIGVSWRTGCPVPISDLQLLQVTHWDFAAKPRRGRLIVATNVADDLATAFARIFDARFQIERIRPMHTYEGRELASLNDNNTAAFDCRAVTGGSTWSRHSFGTAIDINPRQNPYVKGSVVLPADAGPWVSRSPARRGMIVAGDPVTAAFAAIGWGWGGDYRSLKDYQHFSRSGG